jgi:hypothetical protein
MIDFPDLVLFDELCFSANPLFSESCPTRFQSIEQVARTSLSMLPFFLVVLVNIF